MSTAATARVAEVTARIPGQATQVWTRGADGSWSQTAPRAPRVRVANLLLSSTVYRELQADKAGTTVLNASVVGRGALTAVSGDRLVKGRWNRPSRNAVATYLDSSGVPLRLRPGATWIVMAPPGTTVVGR